METYRLGDSGLRVSAVILGCMSYGDPHLGNHAWSVGLDESRPFFKQAVELGITTFDTANVYSLGSSEEITGTLLREFTNREDVVIATKVHGAMRPGPYGHGLSRKAILSEVDASLTRLGTDYIDLYQIHRPDEHIDIDETLGALSDLEHQGKIRAFGSSTFPAEQIVEAQWVAEKRGRERFRTEQPPYSLLVRGIERDVLPTCLTYGMGVIPWSPLAGGWLSGAFGSGKQNTSRRSAMLPDRYDLSLPANQKKLEVVTELETVALDAGLTMIELALAFVLEHPAVSAAIIGPRTMEHLESQLGATEIVLDQAVLDRIDEIVPPGTNLNVVDAGWAPEALTKANRRRRHYR